MKLVFATHNKNKFREVKELVPQNVELISLTDIGCFDEIPETESTIEGNAQLKARYVLTNYGLNCFADDTGLEVSALGGAPGVYSARYAGPDNNPEANIAKLLLELQNSKDRSAQFKTVIAFCTPEKEKLFTGICRGQILHKPIGDKGFGYDPVFQPEGYDLSFAEMDPSEKGRISHRGKAIKLLIDHL
ncbi:MAG: non-canonical purine NTP diphosphatase [Flavobacteriaceae bacterium]|nr:non-canonical purine NTP diphosphatase [Flavobacteriaceae bacterium]